jgi:hypothetical protein
VADDPGATTIGASAATADSGAADPPERAPGWLRALIVGGLTVDAVLIAASVSFLLPPAIGNVVFQTPLLIVVLIVGTAAVLLRITRPGSGAR